MVEKTATKTKLLVASMEEPTIAAAMDGRFRFATEDQAQAALEKICKRFVLGKDSPPPEEGRHHAITLWVRDYAVTDEEKDQGYRGNFASVTVKRTSGGRFSLAAKKLDVDVAHHPQRERPKSRHPNWGHPILRAVETGKIFPSLKLAEKQLRLLHEEFPEVTIPGKDTLHALIYSRKGEGKPIQKIVIKLKLLQEGGVQLVLKGQQKKKPERAPVATKAHSQQPDGGLEDAVAAAPEGAPAKKTPLARKGKFTTLVVERRRKRKAPVGTSGASAP